MKGAGVASSLDRGVPEPDPQGIDHAIHSVVLATPLLAAKGRLRDPR